MKSIFSIFFKSQNSFDGQESGEEVLYLLRRHPFFIVMRIIYSVLLFFLPLILIKILINVGLNISVNLFVFMYSVWASLLWLGMFYSITMYTLDVWIVTNKRIIDSTQHGFFNRTVSELHISKIQDISVQTSGIIQTFLNFGDLQIQTAGAEEKFKFFQIPNPEKVKDEIMRLVTGLTHLH